MFMLVLTIPSLASPILMAILFAGHLRESTALKDLENQRLMPLKLLRNLQLISLKNVAC